MSDLRLPASSYRLQFNSGFTFEQARTLVPYLDRLGVTDCYTSPLLKSKPGSTHGYDIVDHETLDPALGSPADFAELAAALRARKMGLILDFVPNHMGLDPTANRWWRDVLEHGQSSVYADYFDIDWAPVAPELKGRILLPILQDGYGDVLERGEITLGFSGGALHVEYGEQRLPIDPRSAARVLRVDMPGLTSATTEADRLEYLQVISVLEGLPPASERGSQDRFERQRMSVEAKNRLECLAARSSAIGAHLETVVASFRGVPREPATFDALHELLDEQAYRLAHWKTAFDEINYRRFFDINDLGGIRMEDPRVFEAAHRLVLQLLRRGDITGLRLDHPDGLLDPAEYFERLQHAAAQVASEPAVQEPLRSGPLYILVEKILAPDEQLPEGWPVAGTTGYGFLNCVNGLFVDKANQRSIERIYARVAGRHGEFSEAAYHAKRLIMASSMASELGVLTRALKRIAESQRVTRDFTMNALKKVLVEIVACLPVYRTYVNQTGFSANDREVIDFATDRARRRNPVMASSLFLFVRNVLLADPGPSDQTPARDDSLESRRRLAMKFQQFSAPVQAKGIEDTAHYRYIALTSLNEVGGEPGRFGRSVDEFHAANRVRLEQWPLEMTATATHDTKRGEDARARIDVISEIPVEWRRAVVRWMQINAPRRTAVDRELAPDRNDEYLFYQSLLGIWPAEAMDAPVPQEAPPDVVVRVRQFMQKAIKEAKVHTSWFNQNGAYEDAVSRFIDGALTGASGRAFLESFIPFQRRVAIRGMVNSLAQLVLKIASPGVPDFFQGSEEWNLVLADPDNRRPVDFARREAILSELAPWIATSEATWNRCAPSASRSMCDLDDHVRLLLGQWSDARIKTFLMACGLRLRRHERRLLLHGAYGPVMTDGTAAAHLVGFVRFIEGKVLLAVVPRLMSQRLPHGLDLPTGLETWGDTRIGVPGHVASGPWRNVFTGAMVTPVTDERGAWVAASEVFHSCPVALLWSQERSPESVAAAPS